MSNQVHGHDVMQMMIDADTAYTRESLNAAIVEKFGADTRFHTCSADNMSADELITVLEERGKFTPAAEGFKTDASQICNH